MFLCVLFVQLVIVVFFNNYAENILSPSLQYDKQYVCENTYINEPENLSLSYNNRFLAYINEGSLVVIDLINNNPVLISNKKFENIPENYKILNFKWLPDRNILLYFCSVKIDNDNFIILCTLELIETGEKVTVNNVLEREYSVPDEGYDIEKIQVSTYTNVIYYLSAHNNKKELNKIDLMKNINKINYNDENIIDFFVSNKSGTAYVNSNIKKENHIYELMGNNKNLILEDDSISLLGCINSKVFLGKIDNNLLNEVSYFKEDDKEVKINVWKGKIAANGLETFISDNERMFFMTKDKITMIDSLGNQKIIKNNIINKDKNIVIANNGNIYLIIDKYNGQLKYTWKKIQLPEVAN